MPENRNVGVSSSPNPSVDKADEAISTLSHENKSPYPDRPGKPDCSYYMKTGLCGYGVTCKFNHPPNSGQFGGHPERVGEADCAYYLRTGNCKYGSVCKYHHPPDKRAAPVVRNSLGLPMRQEEKPCSFYLRTGKCKFGIVCKFHHPQPAPILPFPGPALYGSTGLSVSPSSGLYYADGLPYLFASPSEVPQSYMPLIYPSFQGGPTPGWTTYMGSLNPVSSTNVIGELGFNGQVPPLPTTAVSHRPECRYFMNTGSCKYGSDCKYSHPGEKLAQLTATYLGPVGLPFGAGQAVWPYPFNYGSNLPDLSMLGQSLFPYQKDSPLIHSSESSPAKSPKFPDSTGKVEAASNQKLNAKNPEESPEQAGSSSQSLSSASEEPPHNQSD